MENTKINILNEYIEILKASWTYAKLTEEEKERFNHIFYSEQIKDVLKGKKLQIYKNLNMVYSSFLAGVGYTGGCNWREEYQQPQF